MSNNNNLNKNQHITSSNSSQDSNTVQSIFITLPNQAIDSINHTNDLLSPTNTTAPLLTNNYLTSTADDQNTLPTSKLFHRHAASRINSYLVSHDSSAHIDSAHTASTPVFDGSVLASAEDKRRSGKNLSTLSGHLMTVKGRLIPKGSIRRSIAHHHTPVERVNTTSSINPQQILLDPVATSRSLQRTASQRSVNRRAVYTVPEVELTWHDKFANLVDSKYVTLLITTVVLFSIVLALLGFMNVINSSSRTVTTADFVISIFFACEVVTRMIAYGPRRYFTSTLCMLDLSVSMLDWVSYILQNNGLGQIVWLRILRAFRLTRISRIARLSDQSNGEESNQPSLAKDSKGRIFEYNVCLWRVYTIMLCFQLVY